MSAEYTDPQTLERLVRIETKMDFVVDSFKSQESRITALEKLQDAPHPDHESRIRKLERVVWIASGIALAGGGALGTILSNVTGS
jgi:hypothetical protein